MPHISQSALVSAILKHLDGQCPGVSLVPRQANAIIKAANLIVEAIEKEPTFATPGMGLDAWLRSDDAGQSSIYLAHVTMGIPIFPHHYPEPCDPADFGRCVRFLEAVPEARAKLPLLLEGHGPVWAALAKRWDELEALYREELPTGKSPRLYEIMASIRREAGE